MQVLLLEGPLDGTEHEVKERPIPALLRIVFQVGRDIDTTVSRTGRPARIDPETDTSNAVCLYLAKPGARERGMPVYEFSEFGELTDEDVRAG